LTKRLLLVVLGLCAGFSLLSCGGGSSQRRTTSGLPERVLASQGVSSTTTFGGLFLIDGSNDTIARVSPLSAGSSPGLMAVNPTRSILTAFDAGTNSVFAIDTVTEGTLGTVHLPGPTSSMVVPSATRVGYAAVPSATVTGFSFIGAIDVMNLLGAISTTIAVPNAQTVISNDAGTQLLVFNGTDSIYILSPGIAVPPVDESCLNNTPNSVCTIVAGFDRPVYGIVSGNTAYILNCGPQCGGIQASVAVFDLGSLTVTSTIPVEAATWAFLQGSTLYVAGTPATGNDCSGQTTAATVCGRLDVVDLSSQTVSNSYVITDGTHHRMDMSANGQLFVGSYGCTEVGNVNNPVGEVRGCLSILNTSNGTVVIPPDNGDVTGLQGFTSRDIEYVAEGGLLRVYDTKKDILLINDFVPQGTINIVGNIGDIKAIDFF